MIRRGPIKRTHGNIHYYDESLKSFEEAQEYGKLLVSFEGAQGLVKYLSETMSVTDIRAFQSQLRERQQQDRAFPIPLLLLYAQTDPMVSPRFGQVFLQRIPNAELAGLSEASRFAHVDAPEQFLPPVFEFLSRD
jgi:pimeloyl-ACP methyl ester carboxylesterase